jgi:hypothetical protein
MRTAATFYCADLLNLMVPATTHLEPQRVTELAEREVMPVAVAASAVGRVTPVHIAEPAVLANRCQFAAFVLLHVVALA